MKTTARMQAVAILESPPEGVEMPNELRVVLEKKLEDPKVVESILVFGKTGEMEVFAPWTSSNEESK